MASTDLNVNNGDPRRDWVRLRTLILLRWMAILGQLGAITVADRHFGMQLPLGACYTVVGASIVANLVAMFAFPQNTRLSENGAMLTLLFDVSQLSVLVYLTGGLSNPFTLLILAPVTISASALGLRSTIILAIASMLCVTLVAAHNVPIRLPDGTALTLPAIFAFGFWLSIVIGILFLALYSRRVAFEIRAMSDALFATQVALSREQALTGIGGVVAAAAHELGTPLATIKVASTELIDELTDRPDLREDARLIRTQADRCRDILRAMGREGSDDQHMKTAPFESVLREAAEPHLKRGKTVHFRFSGGVNPLDRQPTVRRRPEIVHGLRNLTQNAVDFSVANVWIEGAWTADAILLRISDDGPGFPVGILGRIGDPFVKDRRSADRRPGYEGMGLGLFIAKTLLERTGAKIKFSNGADPFLKEEERPDNVGATIRVTWRRKDVEPDGA